MKQRVITSVLITAATIAVLFLSLDSVAPIVYPIVLSLLAFMAAFEILRVFSLEKKPFVAVVAYLFALAMPSVAYFMRDNAQRYLLILSLVVFCFILYIFAVSVFERGHTAYTTLAAATLMLTYITAAFSSLVLIRYFDKATGFFCLGMVFISAWITDVFAYLTGSFIGKHKLIPEVSPKKTVEGSLGGIIFSTLFMLLYGFIVSLVTELEPNYLVLGLSGLVLSVVSQLGDLFASVVKREREIKDYGNVFPGHGGIMDRFDSILAVALVATVICVLINPFAA